MKLINILHNITALALCIALSGTVHASSINSLKSDIKNYQTKKITLNQDLEFTQFKLKAAQEKLTNLQRELKSKELQLKRMKSNIGKSPTPEQKDFIANENKRIDLGATSIKSRKAAITRLRKKEANIRKKIARTDTLSSRAKNKIASLSKSSTTANQAANSAKAYRLKKEMEELKKENEQLRIAMAEEAGRVRSANTEKKEFKQLAQDKELALKEAELNAAKKALELEKIQKLAKRQREIINQDQSQVVLPGERPIYKKSDGKRVVIRNRGKRKSSLMRRTGEYTYQAEVELDPGKSYFDVKRRRYRGHFPEKSGRATYVFSYDLSDKKRPKLTVKRKVERSNQMISNANDPF